jgi:very-short-patch-repair endonuclease
MAVNIKVGDCDLIKEKFTINLEDLLYLTQKHLLVRHLKKNYKEHIHYIVKNNEFKNNLKRGGHNRITYKITKETFELFKNTYNLRNNYIVEVNDEIKHINIGMCIENQTIGFIKNSYDNIFNMKRQYSIGKYRVDLYFIDYKLVIECDENNHFDRDPFNEKIREEYILSLGNKIIRFNPNDSLFDLSNVLKKINFILFSKKL